MQLFLFWLTGRWGNPATKHVGCSRGGQAKRRGRSTETRVELTLPEPIVEVDNHLICQGAIHSLPCHPLRLFQGVQVDESI